MLAQQQLEMGGNRLCGWCSAVRWADCMRARAYHTFVKCVDMAQIYFYTQQPELMLFTACHIRLFLLCFITRAPRQHPTVAKEIFHKNISSLFLRNFSRKESTKSIESGRRHIDNRGRSSHISCVYVENSFPTHTHAPRNLIFASLSQYRILTEGSMCTLQQDVGVNRVKIELTKRKLGDISFLFFFFKGLYICVYMFYWACSMKQVSCSKRKPDTLSPNL